MCIHTTILQNYMWCNHFKNINLYRSPTFSLIKDSNDFVKVKEKEKDRFSPLGTRWKSISFDLMDLIQLPIANGPSAKSGSQSLPIRKDTDFDR